MKFHCFCLFAITSIFLTGCSDPQTTPNVGSVEEPPALEQPEVPSVTDDTEVVSELTGLGAQFKKDDNGLITEVSLIGTSATDSDLEQLGKLTRLSSLRLNETNVSDAGMKTVGTLANLTNLDLRGCSISNKSMKAIEGLTKLRALRLSGESGATSVDDDGMTSVGTVSYTHLTLPTICSV